ncbi:MAG: hypothetical protein JNM41_13915 [Flavipsychrobacter sp.]|nr:hypothetical protein [Flavipsychrobacter sp.]
MRLVSFLFLLFASGAIEQEPCKPIIWSGSKRLVFEDFCGLPDSLDRYDARSFFEVNYDYIIDYDTLSYDIYTLFIRTDSWIKHNDSALVAHERLHFDIGEIHSRSIKRKLHLLSGKRVDDSVVYNIFLKERDSQIAADALFDSETQHGTLEKQTRDWEKRIKIMLDSLDGYKEPKGNVFVIPKN